MEKLPGEPHSENKKTLANLSAGCHWGSATRSAKVLHGCAIPRACIPADPDLGFLKPGVGRGYGLTAL